MLPFLYASIKSLDNSEHSTSLSIEEISISDSTIECDIQFNTNDKLFTYKSQISIKGCSFIQPEILSSYKLSKVLSPVICKLIFLPKT